MLSGLQKLCGSDVRMHTGGNGIPSSQNPPWPALFVFSEVYDKYNTLFNSYS